MKKSRPTGAATDRADPATPTKHIADAVLNLRNLAQNSGHTFLAQLLEMAFHEAFMLANRVQPLKADLEETRCIVARAREWEAGQRRKAG